MAAIEAAMRKFAQLCFDVVKTGQPYNLNQTLEA